MSRRQRGEGEAYNLKVTRCTYVEDDDDNKDSQMKAVLVSICIL